jgi:hypothetical protein
MNFYINSVYFCEKLKHTLKNLFKIIFSVYQRASSIISAELAYPEWQKRFLLGPKGATLQQLVPKQDRLQVS